MNRKWMVAAGVAAILALVLGFRFGDSIISSSETPPPDVVRFVDALSDVSLTYPASWSQLASKDPEVRLVVLVDSAASLSLRVTKSGLDEVTTEGLPVVRGFTDELLQKSNESAELLSEPEALKLGGLPGYRYRYAYKADDGAVGAHVHYFLFKSGRLVQLVFQAQPATKLASYEATFERIAGTFRGRAE